MSAPAPSLPASPDLPRAAQTPLFRAEVMSERQTQWLGAVLLEPRISHWVFATVGLIAGLGVICLLVFGTYTRKAQIHGWLVPHQGMVRIFAPQVAVVTQVHVQEGATVRRGAPLLGLSTELHSEAMGATREEVVRRLRDRRDSMGAQKRVQEQLFDQQALDLERRMNALQNEKVHLARELNFQRTRLALSDKALKRDRALRARDLIAEPRLQLSEQDQLEQASKLQSLERSQSTLDREYVQVRGLLQEAPFRRETQLAEIARNVATLEQELAEAETRRQIVLTAPQDGVVTAIQADPGGSANPAAPLMSIVPTGSVLEAQLFSPTRAVGFVRAGQRVLLRYQAFPYQKFGFYEGTVASVSRSTVSPSELTQQLAGLTSLVLATEPVYRITVKLARQTATAYGEAVPLQPGMQLEADVLIENRRLIEWILDPLFTLTGRWDR